MNKENKIFLAGHNGMVGSAIYRKLLDAGYSNIIVKDSSQLDLKNQKEVEEFFKFHNFDEVILTAAKVGGIGANIAYPAEFFYDNSMIQNNVIWNAFTTKVKRFIFLGSSCIYPFNCQQPMKEEYILSGPLEPTNEGYALAKISGIKLLKYLNRQYGFKSLSLQPCNLYGDKDNFDLNHAHVLGALVRKFIEAVDSASNQVEVWGSGKPRRELMHVRDLADAVIFLLQNSDLPFLTINVGTGEDISIKELAIKISKLTGFNGDIVFNTSKPDGMLVKRLEVSRLHDLGFKHSISLDEGIQLTIEAFKNSI